MNKQDLTSQEKQFIKKRIMLKATLFALSIVFFTSLIGLLILSFIK